MNREVKYLQVLISRKQNALELECTLGLIQRALIYCTINTRFISKLRHQRLDI